MHRNFWTSLAQIGGFFQFFDQLQKHFPGKFHIQKDLHRAFKITTVEFTCINVGFQNLQNKTSIYTKTLQLRYRKVSMASRDYFRKKSFLYNTIKIR